MERDISSVKSEIKEIVKDTGMFDKITQDKDVEGFTRLIIHYNTELGNGSVFIDLNERGKLLRKPENKEINHFYPNIPPFNVPCLSLKEMVAEKIAAAIGRNKPRDHYDIYQIIKRMLPIELSLVKRKCQQSGHDFNIIKMFNKAKKLKNRWDNDMIALISEDITFQEVMKTLAKHFNLKDEKEKVR